MADAPLDFDADVVERSKQIPVLVDFWAPWCGPCRMLGPLLEKVAEKAGGRWQLIKVDIDQRPELADRFGITSIPNVKLFRDGSVADEFLGFLPEDRLERWIGRHLPSPHSLEVGRARNALESGCPEEAAPILEAVLAAEGENEEARFLLAQCRLKEGPSAVVETIRFIPVDSEYWERGQGLVALARILERDRDPKQLPEGSAADSYAHALSAVSVAKFDAGLSALAESLAASSSYHQRAAGELSKAIFQTLGFAHPLAERFRPEIARLLYS